MRPLAGPIARVHANYVWDWVVNAKATPEQKRVAWDFVRFITEDQQQVDLWKAISLMPTRKSVYESEWAKSDPFLQAFGQYVNDTKVYYPPIPQWEQVERTIISKGELLVAGEITEQEFLDQAEKEVNEILSQQ
jgi:ABC-type glycerol-3-phosphate transport system substrate-binding protein